MNKYLTAALAFLSAFYKRITGKVRYPKMDSYTPTPRRTQRPLGEHGLARKHGIPKAFRQYAKRYGNLDISGILQVHRQAKSAKQGN